MVKSFITNFYKSVSGQAEYALNRLSNDPRELVVLCMHSTPADRIRDFKKLVDFLLAHFKPILPAELKDYFRGEMKNGPYILFTFDDGLRNNLYAASALEEKNMRAIFFLVPAFIESKEQEKYYRKNIRQIIDPSVDKLQEDFTAISYHEAANLAAKGHGIGSHTYTHMLRKETSTDYLFREIVSSRLRLEQECMVRVESFCSPINTSISVNAGAKKLVEENYTYHFTTFPGLNAAVKDPLLILRRNIEVQWSPGKIRFALGRWDLSRWSRAIQQFQALH